MDPLTVLPVEVVQMVARLLAPADLLSLAGVSRAWRRWAKDPALWGAVRLRFPGDRPGLLRLAPAIHHLELRVADLKPPHLSALEAGRAEVQHLTCLRSAAEDGDSTDAATLVRILQRVSPSLRSLKILTYVHDRRRHSEVQEDKERALKIIVAMPRLRELRLGDMSFHHSKRSVQVPLRGTLESLCVDGEASDSWADTVVDLLRAHRTSLRSLELHQISPMNGAVVASIAKCRELRSLTLEVPSPCCGLNLISAYKHHTKRIYRQLPKRLIHLEHLKLLLPCPFDVDSSAHTNDGKGVGLDKLAAGLRKHCRTLLSMELVVLCDSPNRAARVEANEALLRSALPATATVKARVETAYCLCARQIEYEEDGYEVEYENMIDIYYDAQAYDACSYTTSDDESMHEHHYDNDDDDDDDQDEESNG